MTVLEAIEWLHERHYELEEVHSEADGSFTIRLNGVFDDEGTE